MFQARKAAGIEDNGPASWRLECSTRSRWSESNITAPSGIQPGTLWINNAPARQVPKAAPDAACLDYLEWLRGPEGIRCPRCVSRDGWRLGSGRWECGVCGRQASVTAGTIFHRTRTPLRLWFAAAWQMTSQKHGVSALGVQRSLGLGSYQTAWAMLHRYRAAMVRPGRERLAGHVEVDEGYLGGVEGGVDGRKTETKAIVAIAVEIKHPKGFGRIRLKHVPDVSAESLLPFIDEAVQAGATIHTDGWQAYWKLGERGYEHERTVMRQQSDPAHVVMPGVHRVASLLARWLLGTHQGRVGHEHLDAYLNEFHVPL